MDAVALTNFVIVTRYAVSACLTYSHLSIFIHYYKNLRSVSTYETKR